MTQSIARLTPFAKKSNFRLEKRTHLGYNDLIPLLRRTEMAKTKKEIKLKVRIPHVLIDARGCQDTALLDRMVSGLEQLEARVRILGEGAKKIPHAFSLEEAMEEAHIWVILSDQLPKEFPDLIERGIVPVMLQGMHPEAKNYSPSQEDGNAFLFPALGEWRIYGAIVRALENFHFSYDWNNLKNHGKSFIV
jgi:hypothetical protein